MLRLDVQYADGTQAVVWGDVDWIEQGIESIAQNNKAIIGWTITEEQEL